MSVICNFYFELSEEVSELKDFIFNIKCSNGSCNKRVHLNIRDRESVKFCSLCGSEIKKEVKEKRRYYPSSSDFFKTHLKEKGEVAMGGYEYLPNNIWIYNYTLPQNLLRLGINENNVISFKDLSDVNMPEAIEEFKQIERVKLFLEKFEEVYGKGTIKVCYGALVTD